jgi:predicted Rossmann fold nucleotide-binding protein DprA/Smf involved in DNA uptake
MALDGVVVGVVGSRGYKDAHEVFSYLDTFENQIAHIQRIVSGGAPGADMLAARYAIERHIPLIELFPQWTQYGKQAGAIRNRAIVDASDVIVAFWDGNSPGTRITMNMALKAKKPCYMVNVVGRAQLWDASLKAYFEVDKPKGVRSDEMGIL